MTRGPQRLVAALASLVTGVGAALLVVTPPAQAADPVRILLEGDSITQGFNGDFTWRYRLDRELRRQRVAFDLVGSQSGTFVKPGFTSSRYLDPTFDRDHFAFASTTIGWHNNVVSAEVAQQKPDVIVFAAGVNDLRNGATPQQTDARLRMWISKARAAAPTATIVISPVLDATDLARPWLLQRIREFRAIETATIAQLDDHDTKLVLADTARGWSVATMTTDNLHPTATGETFIAQRIAETLQRIHVLPSTPQVYRATAWPWAAGMQVTQVGRRLRVAWDPQALGGAHVWVRRVSKHARAKVSTVFYTGSFRTPVLARGARYDVRVQFTRGRAATTWTATKRVRIKRTHRPAPVTGATIDATGVHWTASATATRYVVKYRTASSKRWKTRRTKGVRVYVAGVTRAKVSASNSAGSSAYRAAHR